MDIIDTIDWGAYSHFTFVAGQHPALIKAIQEHYQTASYVLFALTSVAVLVIFIAQSRRRALLVGALGVVGALGTIELCRLVVPRHRPPDARELVGAAQMLGSYPSAGVFLFMLLLIYLGFALWPWLRSGLGRCLFVVFAAALTVGAAMSQFFLATHFVSDVVGGMIGATIVGFIVSKFLDPPVEPTMPMP